MPCSLSVLVMWGGMMMLTTELESEQHSNISVLFLQVGGGWVKGSFVKRLGQFAYCRGSNVGTAVIAVLSHSHQHPEVV